MKKSKILIPAVAVLALSVGASVTGTVAWFTSSRTATVSAGVFESKALSANLKVKSTALVGMTTKDSEATDKSTITVDGALTHGSYNATKANAGLLYVANTDDDKKVTSYSSLGDLATAKTNASAPTTTSHSKWWAGEDAAATTNKYIWYGVAWEMAFTAGHNVDDTVSLFVDYKSTTFTDGKDGGTTMPGLRIALMTANTVRVIGGEAETNHVTGTTTEDVDKFDTGVYNVAGASYTKAVDKTDFSTNVGLIDKMTVAESKVSSTLTVTAVAWFEGESTAVVSDNAVMSKVTASLAFYTRINKASA